MSIIHAHTHGRRPTSTTKLRLSKKGPGRKHRQGPGREVAHPISGRFMPRKWRISNP